MVLATLLQIRGCDNLCGGFHVRPQRIGRLAALADGEDESVRRHRRVTVPKLAREFNLGWNAGEIFDEIFADHGGVHGSAATGQDNAPDLSQLRRRHIKPPKFGRTFFRAEAAGAWRRAPSRPAQRFP